MPVRSNTHRTLIHVGVLLFSLFTRLVADDGSSYDTTFVERLCERKLYQIARSYCEHQMVRPEVDDSRRVLLGSLLVRSFGHQAMDAKSPQRWEIVEQTRQAYGSLQQQFGGDAAWIVIAVEYESLSLRLSELQRLEAEFQANPEPELEAVRSALRQATDRLRKIVDGQNMRPPTERDPQDRTRLPNLAGIEQQLRFLLAETYRQQALCFGDGTTDRINSLTLAASTFDALARLSSNSQLTVRSQLGEIECQRLLKDFTAAAEQLTRARDLVTSPEDQVRFQTESALLLIDTDQAREALAVLPSTRSQVVPAEVQALADLARMRAFVALWRKANSGGDSQAAEQWQNEAVEQLRHIEQYHTPYWTRRAELELAATASRDANQAADVEVLARTAANLYRRQQIPEALAAYSQAAQLANQLNLKGEAFELGFQVAAIHHQNSDAARASEAFRRLAMQHADHSRAADAHWLAIANAASLVRQDSSHAPLYAEILQEHLTQWPDSEHLNSVRLWYGKLLSAQNELPKAIAIWMTVDPISTEFAEANESIHSAAQQQLRRTDQSDRSRAALAETTASFFEAQFLNQGVPPEKWTAEQVNALINAARLRLIWTNDQATRVLGFLQSADDSTAAASAHERHALVGLALAIGDQHNAAIARFDQVDWEQVHAPLEFVSRVERLIHGRSPQQRRDLSRVLEQIVEGIESTKASLSAADRQQLTVSRARCLIALERWDEAQAAYRQLIAAEPRNTEYLQPYAELQQRASDPESLRQALQTWRKILELSTAGKPGWFEAKYAIARLHFRLGDAQRAEEIVRLTGALHPDLGGAAMKRQFVELLETISQNAPSGPLD